MTQLDSNLKAYFNQNFQSQSLSGQTFEDVVFEDCTFKNCDFSNSSFLRCKFVDCKFENCNLSLLQLKSTFFSEAVFEHCKMIGIDWTTVRWPQVALASPIKFYHCIVDQSNFFELTLNEIVFESCQIKGCDFREADLKYAVFWQSDLLESLFLHTNLEYADFSDALNYQIDIYQNKVKQAKFSFPEVVNLLAYADINIVGMGQD